MYLFRHSYIFFFIHSSIIDRSNFKDEHVKMFENKVVMVSLFHNYAHAWGHTNADSSDICSTTLIRKAYRDQLFYLRERAVYLSVSLFVCLYFILSLTGWLCACLTVWLSGCLCIYMWLYQVIGLSFCHANRQYQ